MSSSNPSSSGGIYDDAYLNKQSIPPTDADYATHRDDRRGGAGDDISGGAMRGSSGASASSRINLPHNAINEIFVTGLHWSVTDALMDSFAKSFGDAPVDISFLEDKTNGKSKGICLIQFATPEQAYKAKMATEGQQITEECEKAKCYYPSELPVSMDPDYRHAGHGRSSRQRSLGPSYSDAPDDRSSRGYSKRPRDYPDRGDRYAKRRRSRTPQPHPDDRYERRY